MICSFIYCIISRFLCGFGCCFGFRLWFVVSLFLCLPFGAFCILRVYLVCHFQVLLIYLFVRLTKKLFVVFP